MRRFLRISLALFLVLGASLLVYRQILLSQIPEMQKSIPIKIDRDVLPVPKRPGTQSVRIVGPPLKILKFEIDFTRNPRPLDWKLLERTDKRADVMIEGVVDDNGNFRVAKLRDRGHPKAGSYIKSVVSSWRFTPYRRGRIRYYFNVPTRLENMKIQIDLRDMEKNFTYIGPRHQLKNGILCYVDGLNSKSIMVIN